MKLETAYVVIILALFLAGIPFDQRPDTAQASPIMTTFKVEPETSDGAVGTVITLSVNVYDTDNLWGWQVYMAWNPAVLGFDSFTFGNFLAGQPEGTAQFNMLDYVSDGWLMGSETTFGKYPGVTAESGWFMDVDFEVLSDGETTISIDSPVTLWQDSVLTVYGDDPDEMIKENGSFSNVGPPNEPPTAAFTFSPPSPLPGEAVTFDASASSDPDGTIVSWGWDFGDLASASGEVVTHSYAVADTYTVTLTVTDDDGLADTTTQAVTVTTAPVPEPPVASFTYSPLSPVVGDTVSFDASGSSDADGTIVSFEWNFGDSTTRTGVTVTHAYAAADIYTVTLTVTDDDGLADTATDDVPVSPGAPIGPNFSISASPSSLTIQQGDSDVSAITVTSVEGFSDPVILSVSSCPSDVTATLTPTEVTPPPDGFDTSALTLQVGLATAPGNYYLTVTGTNDTLEHSIEIALEITERPLPYALFTHSPSDPKLNDTVAFDGSDSYDPDGIIRSYEWDFGDETIGIGEVTSHIYTTAGVFIVTLTVADNDGMTGISTQPITIAKLSSTISIAVSNTTIYAIDSVVINGTINPLRAEATVTVWCRPSEEEAWHILTTVTTDENSEYAYTWMPSETGNYELKTKWTGDVDTLSAESSIENVDVIPLPVPSIAPAFFLLGVFSLACLLAVGCTLIVWSFLKRRRKKTALTG